MARKPVANDQAAAQAADALLSGEARKGNIQTHGDPLFDPPSKGVTVMDATSAYPPILPTHPAPQSEVPAPKSELFEMDMATMAKSLTANGGLDVRLGNVAQWSPEQREEARRWIVQKWELKERPKFLDAYAKPQPSIPVAAAPSVSQAPKEIHEPLEASRQDPTKAHSEKAEPPPLFINSNKGPKVSPDFARIIETVYAADAMADYADLEKHLEVGEERGDYLTLRERLDKAQVRRGRAFQLLLGAKLELFNWERDAEATMAAMRNRAHDELQAEKDAGARNKAITDADVVARIAQRFPNEYKSQELTRHKLKGAVAAIESFVDRWTAKAFDLRCLLETLRK